jgi:bacterioferritin (cytochrome b1)
VGEPEERLDVREAVSRLNGALELQYRSAHQYMLSSGSLFGFEFLALGDRLWEFAQAELADARRLIEKIVALGGAPTTKMAAIEWTGEPDAAVDHLVETEAEAVETLQKAIEPTGREGRSEALEHMLEHVIMRKQDQIDFLLRARRRS